MAEVARRRRQGLTPPASRFIGREADLAALRQLFEQGARLVTLWGPAGMGKTRLSLQAALAWAEARPEESVWVAELADARDLEALCSAVARTLEIELGGARSGAALIEQIGRFLAAQGPALLVVDNLEQVVEEAAPALDRWIRMAPELRLLATSRERCRIAGEVGYELSPLSLPSGEEPRSEAVELFLDRVRGKRPGLPLGEESVASIGTLVCRLEGIPLAIELAAARYDVLGLEGLLARLENRLGLLSGGRRGVDARQATLRNAIEWSWDLLDEAERRALARCAVFRGGFSLEAADVVLDEPDGLALDRVEALRDKSLLKADARSATGAVRFALYEGVREFAAEKLAERGERETARARHAAFYLGAGEADAERFARTGALDALHRVAGDLENLLAVVDHALEGPTPDREKAERALRALLVLDPVLTARGPFDAQLALLDRALVAAAAAGFDPALEARALAARGRARQLCGREQEGLADLEQARDRGAALGSAEIQAGVLTDLGVLHHARRDLAGARAYYEEALVLHRRRGDRRAEGRVLGNLGALHHDERSFDEAMRYYERALAITAAIGDRRSEGIFSTNAGLIDQERGALLEARRRYERAAALLAEVGDRRLLSITIGNLGVLQHEEGRLPEALLSHERASALLREVGDRRSEAIAESRRGAVLASLDRFDEAQRALLRAEQLLARLGDELGSELVSLAGAFLDLAQGRLARVEKRVGPAAELLAAARRKLARAREGSPSLADRSDDIRLIARILERNLALSDAGSEGAGAGASAEELLLAPEARWCRAPGGGWQDLRERHAVRRLLLALALHQREAPGRGLSLGALQEAGWPGEKILPEAASNRIYVAFNQLRKLGLKAFLQKSAEGYFLDPALPVHHVAFEPA
jgi:predicted ATPase/Tfp pilus assembly protein PilF